MWWVYLLWTLSIAPILAQDDPEVEEFKAMLQEATTQVFRQHMEEMSQLAQPPKFDMSPDFMRSFLPNTGVGNREELIIESIQEIHVFHDSNFTQWHYKRFNNTDYVLGARKHNVVLNHIEPASDDYVVFSKDEAILDFVPDHWSIVTDVVMFTRFVKRSAVLYVAILTESSKNSRVNVYEVIGDKGVPVTLIDLGVSSSVGPFAAKKISYVQSRYGGSLVVLIDTPRDAKINYQQKGSNELNHYIEVYYPSAVDIVTFMVQSHGYIAVSNITTCEVFKMDEFSRSHLLFERLDIPSGDLVDIEYFRLGFHHYLAVSGRNRQYLYMWKSGEFALNQVFNEQDVSQLYPSTIPTCRDDVLLFLVKNEGVSIYTYSAKNEIFMQSNTVLPPNFRISPGSVTSFTHNNKAFLMFLDREGNLLAFTIHTSLQPVQNPVLVAGEKIAKQLKSVQEMLEEQTWKIQNINDVLQNAVRRNGDQHITAYQSFENLHSTNGTVVHEVKEPIFIEWDGSSLTLEEYKKGTEMLEMNIEELEELVREMEQIIPDIVRTDRDALITGTKKFTGDISGSAILALSANLKSAAGVNVPQLQKDLYRLDKPQKIEGTLKFEKPLTIIGNLDVAETVNGIDISKDVMTTDTKQTSYAAMSFKKGMVVQGDLHLSGKLNDIDVGDEVVTLSGHHNITGRKNFLNGIIAGNVGTKLLNGVDINDVYYRALTKSEDQEVPGTKTFSGGLVTNNIVLHGTLNGYNVTDLAENIVRVDKPAYISGHKTFTEDVTIQSYLTVDGTVNGLRIPDDLFLTDVIQNVTGYKEFTGTVTAQDVVVMGTVDDLNIPEDIVTLSGDEEVPSTLVFTEGITVDNDIIVEGLVDGVDISEVVREAFKLNETSEFKNAVFLGPVTITDTLSVGGMVNKVDLDSIVKDIVFKNEKDIVIESEKSFKKVVADTVKLDRMINGYNIDVDFMKVDGDQIVNGTKSFKKPVTFNSITIGDGMIGDLNITRLYQNRISLLIEEEIERDIEFSDHVIVEGDLVVHGTIGGLRIPQDIVLKSSTEPIANKVFTNRVTTDNLVVNGDTHVSGSFGGIDLNKFYNDRITLSGDQEIQGDVWISSSSVGKLDLTGFVNGKNITEFANNVMSKTKDQEVLAEKNFSGTTTVFGPITTEEGVNGVDLAELNDRAFKLYEDNYVTEPLGFEDITVKDMVVSGLINGVNVTHLAEDSLKKNAGVQHVTGVNHFEAGFHVEGDILADRVNDMVIPENILLKSTPQTITGKFTLGSVGIAGNLHVEGLVNGLDLSKIAPQLVRTDSEAVIESNVTFIGPIHVYNDIEVTGLVNGIDLKNLPNNVLLKSGDQEITGHKVLRGNVTISGDVDVDFINGVDWQEFLADVVRIDIPQTIQSPKTFTSDAEATDMYAGQANVKQVNGKNLQDFLDDAVFTDIPANITGPKIFRRPVEISNDLNVELINGLRLRTDVITLMCNEDGKYHNTCPQVITGQKSFENLTAYGDIHVQGLVNSYNLYELYHDTLLTEGNQTVLGKKSFEKETSFKSHVFAGAVNGMVLHRDLVTLDTNQEISGPVVFNGDVFIEKDLSVHGLVNGVNITLLAEEAVYLDTNETIEGAYNLEAAIVANEVTVDGLVNGYDLAVFNGNVSTFWQDSSESLVAMDKHSKENCETAKYLQGVLAKSYYILDGFEVHQKLDHPARYIQVKTPKEITLVHSDESTTDAAAVPNVWDSMALKFVSSGQHLRTTIARTIYHRIGHSEIVLSIGISDNDSFVSINGQPVDVPRGFRDASVLPRSEAEVVIALLFPLKGICELYRISVHHPTAYPEIENYGGAPVGRESTSVAIFEIKNSPYLAVSRLHNPPYLKGFCKIYGKVNEGWQRIQSIALAASTSVKHFIYHNYHYLAFTNIAPVHETREPKSIQIYRNSGPNELWFNLFQKIPFDDAMGLEIFNFGDLSELYLSTWNATRVRIFRLEGESGLKTSYTLHGKCIKDVKALLINEDIYLAVGKQNLEDDQPVSSLLYKGQTKGVKYTPHNFTHC